MKKETKRVDNDNCVFCHCKKDFLDPGFKRLYNVEWILFSASELLWKTMSECEWTQSKLARKLKWPTKKVKRLMSGDHDFSLKQFAEMMYAMESSVEIVGTPVHDGRCPTHDGEITKGESLFREFKRKK